MTSSFPDTAASQATRFGGQAVDDCEVLSVTLTTSLVDGHLVEQKAAFLDEGARALSAGSVVAVLLFLPGPVYSAGQERWRSDN